MKRPTFFLSSTIYDFADLRSAVKFILEKQGCNVLASDHNDFNKPLDTHSYKACLESIKNADFFVLFIGTRVGGWFDKENRVSITQREYREAYELHKQGKLKLINFVREEVWQHKEDRKALVKYLESIEIENKFKQKIANYPTKNISDAQFIVDFINEVGRNKETLSALTNGTDFPTGNWLHVFHSFKDIVDVLQLLVFSGQPIEEAMIKRLLRRELIEILRLCLVKFKEASLYSPRITIELFHKEHSLTADIIKRQFTTVNAKRWDLVGALSISLLRVKLHPLILPQALSSMVFLRFDPQSGICKESPVYEALYLLQEEIKLFQRANISETLEVVYANTPRDRSSGSKTLRIETMKLIGLLHLFDRWINIIELSKSIIKHLDGEPFVMPLLRAKSPIPEMVPRLEEESVTNDDVYEFLKSGY